MRRRNKIGIALAAVFTLALAVLAQTTHTFGALDVAQNWTATQRFSAGVSADGTHTETIPSTTSTLMDLATAQSPGNKNLTAASNGNTVSLLNMQGVQSPITGTGAAATLYTYTLPANVLAAGKGVRIKVKSKHTTGTAATTFTMTFGGTSIGQGGGIAGAANAVAEQTLEIFNNSAVTNAQTYGTSLNDGNVGALYSFVGTTGIDTTAGVIITAKFNVAGTDAWTPELFTAELIQ